MTSSAKIKISFAALSALLCALVLPCDLCAGDSSAKPPYWREDFRSTQMKGEVMFPKDWSFKAKMGVPRTEYFVKKDNDNSYALCMRADKSSGPILRDLSGLVDLKKTPVMRWKWKADKLPEKADGRDVRKDDQAVAIYVGCGMLRQDSVSYRWDTETPAGAEGSIKYAGGTINVKWFSVKDKETGKLGLWYVEQRNVAKDFEKAFGYVPDRIAISILSNSQYTGSLAEASLQWIEFLPVEAASVAADDSLSPEKSVAKKED